MRKSEEYDEGAEMDLKVFLKEIRDEVEIGADATQMGFSLFQIEEDDVSSDTSASPSFPSASKNTTETRETLESLKEKSEGNALKCLSTMKNQLELWGVIRTIYKYRSHDIQEFLCAELSRFEITDIEFYLPQLTNLLLNRPHETDCLENFILELCSRSVHLAMKFFFIIRAAVEDNIPDTVERARSLHDKILTVVVNSDERGHCTMDFWINQLCLIRNLTRLAVMLNAVPERVQNPMLKLTLDKLSARLSPGIYLPITRAEHDYHTILNLVSSDSFTLGTKARTPYMLFYQTAHLGGKFENLEEALSNLNLKPKLEHEHKPEYGLIIDESPKAKDEKMLVLKQEADDNTATRGLPRYQAPKNTEKDGKEKILDRKDSDPMATLTRKLKKQKKHRKMTQSENSTQLLLDEIQQLKDEERVTTTGESPLGDAYFVNFVEEFYCPAPSDVSVATPVKTREETEDWVLVGDDESTVIKTAYGDLWPEKKERLAKAYPYAKLPGWDLNAVIVKAEDDLRQEQMAMQVIKTFADIFEKNNIPVYIRPYEIIATSSSTGFIQVVPNAVSVHSLKNRFPDSPSLEEYFTMAYGSKTSKMYQKAVKNFMQSLAGYSVICYLLQIKDRHNGNILLETDGHLVHIDFGFLLTISPGNINFENAPFKITTEYINLLGGTDSKMFKRFKLLFFKAFMCARQNYEKIVLLIEMMMPGHNIGCIGTYEDTIKALKERFQLDLSYKQCLTFTAKLIHQSYGSWRTYSYDEFQRWTNGINP